MGGEKIDQNFGALDIVLPEEYLAEIFAVSGSVVFE